MLSDAPLRRQIRDLGDLLGEVIRDQAGLHVFELVEEIRSLSKSLRKSPDPALSRTLRTRIRGLNPGQAYQVLSAFAIYFQLVNLAEDLHRNRAPAPRSVSPIDLRGAPLSEEGVDPVGSDDSGQRVAVVRAPTHLLDDAHALRHACESREERTRLLAKGADPERRIYLAPREVLLEEADEADLLGRSVRVVVLCRVHLSTCRARERTGLEQ